MTFRNRPLNWFVIVSVAFLEFGVIASVADTDGMSSSDKVSAIALTTAMTLPILWALRCCVRVDGDGVVLVGYFRTRRFAWAEVAGATASWGGLHLLLRNGSEVTNVYLARPAWDVALSRTSAADRAADAISQSAAGATGAW